jgi:DNA processing protein
MDKRTPGTAHLTDEQRIDWLRLIRSDRIGRSRYLVALLNYVAI